MKSRWILSINNLKKSHIIHILYVFCHLILWKWCLNLQLNLNLLRIRRQVTNPDKSRQIRTLRGLILKHQLFLSLYHGIINRMPIKSGPIPFLTKYWKLRSDPFPQLKALKLIFSFLSFFSVIEWISFSEVQLQTSFT